MQSLDHEDVTRFEAPQADAIPAAQIEMAEVKPGINEEDNRN